MGELVRTILRKLDNIYADLEANVTYIYGRRDLHLAADLVYHSILRFYFLGQLLPRGWTECLVIGDTRTGKSTMITRLKDFYECGCRITGENATFAGLVGGIDEVAANRIVNWGILPCNDRGMVIIDEIQECDPEIISRLSNVRTDGIAEIVKIKQRRAHARVRQLWIANPRNNMTLGQFDYGCNAIKGIIGKPEDIARFDFAISAGVNDVPDAIYRLKGRDLPKRQHRYSAEALQVVISYAWSRRPKQVIIPTETEDAIIDYATRLTDVYSQELPLVVKAEQKVKHARLSVALAARLFNYDRNEPKNLIVLPEHAATIYWYLDHIYRKNSFRYYDRCQRAEADKAKVRDHLRVYGRKLIRALYNTNPLSSTRIGDLFNDREESKKLWAWLLCEQCVIQGMRGNARKTETFTDVLRELVNDPATSEEWDKGMPEGI
jgi:hypothetical protein